MTTLDFADGLIENQFSFHNMYSYYEKYSYGLHFCKDSQNYPFIMKGGMSDDFELEYVPFTNQLRGRLLNTKRLKEVMNNARIPLYFVIKQISYLIGKGFLSTFDPAGNHRPLFMACVDGMKNISSIQQVKFYVSKELYGDSYKAVQPAIKDIVEAHSGDVIMCNNILDYLGERLTFPRGGSLSGLNKYKQAVIRTCLTQDFVENLANEPLTVESNHGTVSIESPDSIDTIFDMMRTMRFSTDFGRESAPITGSTDPTVDVATAMAEAVFANRSTSHSEPDDDLPY